jgi:hypothetical protein
MNRLKMAYRTHRPDLMLAWAGALCRPKELWTKAHAPQESA